MDLTEKPTARSYDAQVAVVGSLLISPECAGSVFSQLQEQDFADGTMRTLFGALRALWLAQTPIDPVALIHRVGEAYTQTLADVMAQVPTAANVEEYARIVRAEAQLGRMRQLSLQILEARSPDEAAEMLRQAEGLLAERQSTAIRSYGEMAQDFLDRMGDKRPADYLDWGFPQLNEKVSISQGRFVVLAAESSVGKTALALQLALGIARKGKKVGFFSLETSSADAMDRIMAQTADVPLPAIKHKRLGEEYEKAMAREIERSYSLQFELIEAAGSCVEDVRAVTLARRYQVIFIDYVQLLSAPGDNPAQQVRTISMELHRMSQQLGVTVIGLSQVTPPPKDAKGRRPELSKENLRESHQLIHDAEAILIMDLSDLNNYQSNRILKVDKNKDGPCTRMLLRFDARHMRFEYQPPVEDSETQASRERIEAMDRNREERNAKAARKRAERKAQESAFEELEGGKEDLPF